MSQEMIEISFPNGTAVVPKGTSPEVLKDYAITKGLASPEYFGTVTPKETGGITGFLKENLDLPLSVAGGITGSLGGFATGGPVGAVVGGVLGSAVGTGTGSLLSDELSGEELQYAEAIKKVVEGAGIDIATLGAGKYLKAGAFTAAKALGYTPKEVAENLIKTQAPFVSSAGSKASLKETQALLSAQGTGATLTKYQTGEASSAEVLAENISRMGIFSSGIMENNVKKVNEAIGKTLTDIINTTNTVTSESIGASVSEIITQGKRATGEIYSQSLSELQKSVNNKTVNTVGVRNTLKAYLKKNSATITGQTNISAGTYGSSQLADIVKTQTKKVSKLDPKTEAYISEKINGFLELPSISARDFLEFDKVMSAEIRQFGVLGSSSFNTKVEGELLQMQGVLKDAMITALEKADPAAAVAYRQMKTEYATGMSGILPEINKGLIQQADKEAYNSLGNLLLSSTNTSKIGKFLSSIDIAYEQAAKSGMDISSFPYKNAVEAKQAIKQGFINKLIPETILSRGSEGFDVQNYKKLAQMFQDPDQNKRLQLIMGKDYKTTKQLFNAIAEAANEPESMIGSIIIRGKEAQAVGALAAGSFIDGGTGFGVGAAVLFTPVLLAKMTTNPKAVDALLALNKKEFKTPQAAEKAVLYLTSNLMKSLTPEERAEVRNSFRE
tara:strand:- start:58 stop:2070 length:2013 start_codon:yes stop_codon:yes gene_type:complete